MKSWANASAKIPHETNRDHVALYITADADAGVEPTLHQIDRGVIDIHFDLDCG